MGITLNRETSPPPNTNPGVLPQHFKTGGTSMLDTGQDNPLPVTLYDGQGNVLSTVAVGMGDGADVTKGAKADAAVTDPTLSASQIALLKGLLSQLQGTGSGAAPVELAGSNFTAAHGSLVPTDIAVMGVNDNGIARYWWASGTASDSDLGNNSAITSQQQYNGSTWDRVRNNTQGTLLASAARTSTTNSANVTNYNSRGVIVDLSVTNASGTGGLSVYVIGVDANGITYQISDSPTAVTASGVYAYEIYPGSTGSVPGGTQDLVKRTAGSIPRTFYVRVSHGDASSYTYSLSYSLIK
ncbi:hypothetical protein [Alicyclobacillus sp. SO9]|uniref:hypothetical protein n=1 Tax=Alicyclobacillus sp. SO9 TaxID=2665646 RepID=UPI0018E6E84B|nr:hypothetical protein [Alicyclobacillus sp. SO9]QQE80937.1 hypothetical protein GI364_11430 [Alicyclobacillus sp. SO9]